MDWLRWTVGLLAMGAVAVLVGGVLWNLAERRVRMGDQRAEVLGLRRLGKFLCVDAGLLLVASIVCYALYKMPAGG